MSLTDMRALALAEPGGHHAAANASLTAHNDILVLGDDPIAFALAGTQAAFVQTHSNAEVHHNGSGGSADAIIGVTAGGSAIFVPPP